MAETTSSDRHPQPRQALAPPLGYQLLGGANVWTMMSTDEQLGYIYVHWARFGSLTQDVVWTIVRSHGPVRAYGVTPFSGEVTF